MPMAKGGREGLGKEGQGLRWAFDNSNVGELQALSLLDESLIPCYRYFCSIRG